MKETWALPRPEIPVPRTIASAHRSAVSARGQAPMSWYSDARADLSRLSGSLTGWAAWRRRARGLVGCPAMLAVLHFRVAQAGRVGRAVHLVLLPFVRITIRDEIARSASIGPGFTIEHSGGTLINGTALIGCNVTLGQGVLIGGVHSKGVPVIGDSVRIGARAILVGNITVGSGSTIGAGAVVVKDVLPGTTVVGNPARLVDRTGIPAESGPSPPVEIA